MLLSQLLRCPGSSSGSSAPLGKGAFPLDSDSAAQEPQGPFRIVLGRHQLASGCSPSSRESTHNFPGIKNKNANERERALEEVFEDSSLPA